MSYYQVPMYRIFPCVLDSRPLFSVKQYVPGFIFGGDWVHVSFADTIDQAVELKKHLEQVIP